MNVFSVAVNDGGAWLIDANLKSAVALVCVAAVSCAPRSWLSARWRSGLWLLALLPLVLPIELPSPTSAWNLMSRLPVAQSQVELSYSSQDPVELARPTVKLDPGAAAASAESAAPGASTARARITWRMALFAVWLTVAVILLARLAWLTFKLWRWIASRPALTDPDVLQIAQGCIPEAGLARTPRIVDSGVDVGPAVAGWLRPVLLFPCDRLRGASTDRLWFILLHEFRHVAAGDTWIIAGLHILCAINWFNPLVWLARRQWIEEREIACDAWVLAQTGRDSRLDYADMLFWLSASQKLPAPLLLSAGMIPFPSLLERRVLAMRHMKSTWRTALAGLAAVIVIGAVAITDRVRAEAPVPTDNLLTVVPATETSKAAAPVAAPIDPKKERRPRVVIAQHAILWNGIWPITVEELKTRVDTMRKDGPVRPKIDVSIGVQFPPDGDAEMQHKRRDDVVAAIGGPDQWYWMNFLTRRGSRGVDRVKTVDDLKHDPSRECSGRIVNASGTPVAGAYVVILPKDAPPEILYVNNGELGRPYDEWWAVSTERGEFRIDPLCADYRVAIIQKNGYAFLSGPLAREGGVYELQPWGEAILKRPDHWHAEEDSIEAWMTPIVGDDKGWPSLELASISDVHRPGDKAEVSFKSPRGRGKVTYAVSSHGAGRLADKYRFEFEVPENGADRDHPLVITPSPLSPEDREDARKKLKEWLNR